MKCVRKPSLFDIIVSAVCGAMQSMECAKQQYGCVKQQYKEAAKNYQLRVTRIL